MDERAVIGTIVRLGRALDGRDWPAARRCLAAERDTDYSSFRGTPPARLTAERFLELRKTGLAGLVTQHLTLGHLVELAGAEAVCRCDFVIHRWAAAASDHRHLHSYGSYVYRLRRQADGWRISGITQVVRRSDGDPRLHGALPTG
ncbi:MAG: nuclear transport factor 2 family protein [Candidatus Rokuibacteriota bacterium]